MAHVTDLIQAYGTTLRFPVRSIVPLHVSEQMHATFTTAFAMNPKARALMLQSYCFHHLALTISNARLRFSVASVLDTSFILSLPATSFVPYHACLCKLVNLVSKISVHVSKRNSAWIGDHTGIVLIHVDSVFRGESHQTEETTVAFLRSQLVKDGDSDVGFFLDWSVSVSARDCSICIGKRTLQTSHPNKGSVFLLPLWSAGLCH